MPSHEVPISVQVSLIRELMAMVKFDMYELRLSSNTNKPPVIEMAKPMENTFNCGAARVITPNVKFTTNKAQIAEIAIDSAHWNIVAPKKIMADSCGGVKALGATGKVSKLNNSKRRKTKCPSTAKNTRVVSTVKN